MNEIISKYTEQILREIVSIDNTFILLAVLVVITVIFLDSLGTHTRKTREATGLSGDATPISIDGAKSAPVRTYVSEIQGLAGRPDALIKENGFIIPIERKPLARKLRDRYIAQLLVYMRLVEEFEGKKPPYGYLILGAKCRRIKIENSPERQAWLQGLIDEMQSVLSGTPSKPSPHPRKCDKCDVREHCAHRHEPTKKVSAKSELLARRAI